MKNPIRKFYEFLDTPLLPWGRVLLAALAIPLVLSFFEPLWNIHMEAPQYPNGLDLDIYSYKLVGGNDGLHIDEINVLNHYIGMRPITRDALGDLDWMPFALGVILLLTLRVAAIGNVRSLLDLSVIYVYITGFALARFVFQLYTFGHDLDPMAPITVEPFTPAIFGSKRIANFTTHSYPQWGSILLGLFAVGLGAILVWHLIAGRRTAVRAERMEAGAAGG